MKKLIDVLKTNPIEAGILLISILALCVSGYYLVPVLITAVTNENSIGMIEWLIRTAIPVISMSGAIFAVLRLNKTTSKGKIVLKLLVAVGLLILFEVVFSLLAEIAAAVIYNMIDGSILTAKITMSFALPLLKLPAYALLFCMAGTVISSGKLFCRYGVKKYIATLIVLLIIHAITLTCTMLGASLLAGILQCVLLAMLITTTVLLTKKIGEDCNNEKKMA